MAGGGALIGQGHLDTPSRASASPSTCDSEVIADPQVHHHRFSLRAHLHPPIPFPWQPQHHLSRSVTKQAHTDIQRLPSTSVDRQMNEHR